MQTKQTSREKRYTITVRLFGDVYEPSVETITIPQVIHHTVRQGRLVIHLWDGSREYDLDDLYDWRVHKPHNV